MGFSWRRSKRFGPFRLSASNRGVSGSVGAGPVRVSRRGLSVRLLRGLSWRWKR